MSVDNQTLQERALNQAKEAYPRGRAWTLVSHVQEFLEGELLVYNYTLTDDGVYECLVYSKPEEKFRLFANSSELAQWVGKFERISQWKFALNAMLRGGIPGFLAVVILITVCLYVLIYKVGATDVPPILANGFTLVLGYYFGRQGAR